MPTLKISWTWKLESALHVGSGISQSGRADALVQRDHHGNPFLAGEAVKGAVRMGAEHVAAWLDTPQDYGDQGTAEPTSAMFSWLFGGSLGARFTPGTYVGGPKEPIVVSSTAINRQTGVAAGNQLRSVEVWPDGLEFKTCFSIDNLPEVHVNLVRSFFLAALASAESIGGRAGVGWGQLAVSSFEVLGAGRPDCNEIARDLSIAKTLLTEQSAAARATVEVAAAPLALPTWYEFEIDLLEPACFPTDPAVSNEVVTEGALRATALRGAFGAYWTRSGQDEKAVRQRLSEFTRWSPGFPVARIDGNCAWCGPMPRSLVKPKRGGTGLYDGFDHNEEESIPLKAASGGWVYAEQGRPMSWGEGQTVARMHVARNYTTGSKQSGALFAKESLLPGGRFRSWVQLEMGLWAAGDQFEVRLGRRTSTGNGRARVTVSDVGHVPPTSGAGSAAHVTIQLLSPAILRDREGHLRAKLDVAGLIEHLETLKRSVGRLCEDGKTSRSRSTPGRRGGWMSTWQQPRAAITTIDEGAVWRLEFDDVRAADAARKVLNTLRQIGERQHEGYGWVAIDPPWLTDVPKAPARPLSVSAAPPPPIAAPGSAGLRCWPGADAESHAALIEIATTIADAVTANDFPSESRVPVRELLRTISTDSIVAAHALLMRKLQTRTRPNGSEIKPRPRWVKLGDWVAAHGVPNFNQTRAALTIFALETMLVHMADEES